MTDQQDSPPQSIQSSHIPEVILAAGDAVHLNLAQYFRAPPGEELTYVIEFFPEGLSIDPATGIVTGTAPLVNMDTPYLVCVTATGKKSQQSLAEYFAIEVTAKPGVAQPEAPEASMVSTAMQDVRYMQPGYRWELVRLIQYIINQHYAVAYLYDGEHPPQGFGNMLDKRQAESGFTIVNFENMIVGFPGELAFSEYGNRKRLLNTLQEMYTQDLPKRPWRFIGISGSDNETIGKAWIIGRMMDLAVSEHAPSDEALFSYRNLRRLRGDVVKPGLRLIP
jgi:hypothetical protein